jgi:hypothetical protein
LESFCSFEIVLNDFAVAFFFGVWLACSVQLDELLDAVIAGCDGISAFLDNSIFGVNFF